MSRPRSVLPAIAAFVCIAAIAAGVYLYRSRYAIPSSRLSSTPLPGLMDQLPSDAPAIAYIDVAALRSLQDSPLAGLLGLASPEPKEDREYADFVRNTGFDYTRDLDRAALAFWPAKTRAPASTNSKTASKTESDDILAIADGRFDRTKIQAYALRSGTVATSGGQSLYQVPGDPPVSFQFLSSTRVVLASGPTALLHLLPGGPVNIAATVLPGAGGPAANSSIGSLLRQVSGAPFFAVARADAIPPAIYADLGQSQTGAMAKSIQGLTLAGRPKADNLELALDAQCDSMTSALQISTLLGGLRILGSMAMNDPKTKSRMTKQQAALLTALLAQVQIHEQENWVRITLAVTPEMLSAAGKH